MAERPRRPATPLLDIRGLNVFYGRSHALQGVDLQLPTGVLAIVGRNGMGKTTLCKTIMGLVPAASGSIRFAGHELVGLAPSQVARLGIGYVPQGRRLWPSLSVDEHLRLVQRKGGAWDVARIYATFSRLGERKSNRGGQLSGGEQQMLAISRALLQNPKLLVLDEPTEGLAPVIVAQVEEMLAGLASEGEMGVLVIEQNIGVACAIAPTVAIMVNGRVNRVMDSATLGADRDLQQRLLGVGRHGHEDAPAPMLPPASGAVETASPAARKGPPRMYVSNPALPTRWSQPVAAAKIEAAARTMTVLPTSAGETPLLPTELRPLAQSGDAVVLVAGTLDTKGAELRFLRDTLRERGVRTRLVDLSTSGKPSSADVTPNAVALHHPSGPGAVFSGDRGTAVAAMAIAFERFVQRTPGIAGIVSAGGSGGTALVTPAMRALPLGVPKLLVSTVASGDTSRYVGPSDILMLYSVTDVAGLNPVLRQVLANAGNAVAGMVEGRRDAKPVPAGKPAVGLTMFGLTTPAVRAVSDALGQDWEPLVFHATGIGGRSMERLIDEGAIDAVVDLTTTEIADWMMGGVFPATEDRFGAVIRRKMPYVGSVGALDMVNFGAPDTVPERYRGRTFYQHNPQITLMRTTPEENRRMGEWIGERVNRMEAPVRFLLPEGGVSGLDAPGLAFHDPEATRALFAALEATVRQTTTRRLVRVPHHINDPAFAAAVVEHFRALHGDARRQRARR